MQISAILVGLFLFFRNVWLIIVLVFVNMKILHHITFWIYKADLSFPDSEEHVHIEKMGEFMIMANLYVGITVFALGLFLTPIMMCYSVTVYSSARPDRYYNNVSSKYCWVNRGNALLNIGPFLLIALCAVFGPQ